MPASAGGVFDLDCIQFNTAVANEIASFPKGELKGVVLASRTFGFGAAQLSVDDGRRVGLPTGSQDSRSPQIGVWQYYLRLTLSAIQKAGIKVLVIAPVPYFSLPVPLCLAHRSPASCGADRPTIDMQRRPLKEALIRTVSEFNNARVWDPFEALCDEHTCAPIGKKSVLYRDQNHLSTDGSRYLAMSAAPQLSWLIH
jgi:hypothetical protein